MAERPFSTAMLTGASIEEVCHGDVVVNVTGLPLLCIFDSTTQPLILVFNVLQVQIRRMNTHLGCTTLECDYNWLGEDR